MEAVEQRVHLFANITAIFFGVCAAAAAAVLFLGAY